MPRPKVKPQDRQRSARACVPCKASKIRCNGEFPCGPCQKRERIDACVFVESSRKRQKRSPAATIPTPSIENQSPLFDPRLSQLSYEHVQQRRANGHEIDPQLNNSSHSAAPTTAATTPSKDTPEPGQTASSRTRSRMLLSSKGEKLYVGENASLSFLQFVRRILKKTMGPSDFTENKFQRNMLEVAIPRDESPVIGEMSRGDKYELVQLYREASSGVLDLFTLAETHQLLNRHDVLSPGNSIEEDDKRGKADQAILSMMLAIGHQCRSHNPYDADNAARSFTCAQKYAFEGLLCDPSLDMVRIFLLMAFYLLQACHRNAAFMYLGIASKAACALGLDGLHSKEHYTSLSTSERIARWRTWKSLLILDTAVSSILGRSGGLPRVQPGDGLAHEGEGSLSDSDRPRWLASRAVFGVCSHIIELELRLGNAVSVDTATADNFLQGLRKWNESVPVELRHFATTKDKSLEPAERELFAGAVHVSCAYYFAIILVTRKFFIFHLVSQIRHTSTSSAVSDLAQACLDSAMYMARTGHVALITSGVLPTKAMVLVKAWMFAAGLLLGFSMFATPQPVPEVDTAFQNALAVTGHLARASPQARHYYEILSTFFDAIMMRRDQVRRETNKRKDKSQKYVSQLFTADFPASEPAAPTAHGGVANAAAGTAYAALISNQPNAIVGKHNIENPASSGLDVAMDYDFDSTSFGTGSASGGLPQSTAATSTSTYDPQMDYILPWDDTMGILSDNLHIDWDTLWPMDGMSL